MKFKTINVSRKKTRNFNLEDMMFAQTKSGIYTV